MTAAAPRSSRPGPTRADAGGEGARRLAIDWTRCDGHGLCAALLPDRIGRDEWGFPILRDPQVPAAEQSEVRRGVAACPALALYLVRS